MSTWNWGGQKLRVGRVVFSEYDSIFELIWGKEKILSLKKNSQMDEVQIQKAEAVL